MVLNVHRNRKAYYGRVEEGWRGGGGGGGVGGDDEVMLNVFRCQLTY